MAITELYEPVGTPLTRDLEDEEMITVFSAYTGWPEDRIRVRGMRSDELPDGHRYGINVSCADGVVRASDPEPMVPRRKAAQQLVDAARARFQRLHSVAGEPPAPAVNTYGTRENWMTYGPLLQATAATEDEVHIPAKGRGIELGMFLLGAAQGVESLYFNMVASTHRLAGAHNRANMSKEKYEALRESLKNGVLAKVADLLARHREDRGTHVSTPQELFRHYAAAFARQIPNASRQLLHSFIAGLIVDAEWCTDAAPEEIRAPEVTHAEEEAGDTQRAGEGPGDSG